LLRHLIPDHFRFEKHLDSTIAIASLFSRPRPAVSAASDLSQARVLIANAPLRSFINCLLKRSVYRILKVGGRLTCLNVSTKNYYVSACSWLIAGTRATWRNVLYLISIDVDLGPVGLVRDDEQSAPQRER
jgi:hypothetical protein